MRRDLVFDTGPDLIGIDKGQRGFFAARPRAEQEPSLLAKRIARTLAAGMLAQVRFEIVSKNRQQRAANLFSVQGNCHAVKMSHPTADNAIRKTAGSILILGTLAFKQPQDFATSSGDTRNRFYERLITQIFVADVLLVVLAVEKFPVDVFGTPFGQFAIEQLVVFFSQSPNPSGS